MTIKVWRLEHNVSKLGPYEHDEKQEVLKYIKSMKDIIEFYPSNDIFKTNSEILSKAVWGWTTYKSAKDMIKDSYMVEKLGFNLVTYDVDFKDIVCQSFIDDQICFLRR